MREYKNDKEFPDKIKRLFEEKFEQVQADASLKTAKLMYKEIKTEEKKCQAVEKEIDSYLIMQIQKQKDITSEWVIKHTLQMNKQHSLENELSKLKQLLKECNREIEVRDGQLEDRERENAILRSENYKISMQLETLQKTYAAIRQELLKKDDLVDKHKHNERRLQKLFDKAKEGNTEKEKMIKEQNGLISELETMANEEQAERIRIVNIMYKKIEKMDKELDQTIKDYAKKAYKKRQVSKNFEFQKTGELKPT